VTYHGSALTNDVAIGEGYLIRAGLSGTDVFGDDASGTFASTAVRANAVRTATGVDNAIAALRASRDQLSAARVIYGNSLNQIDASEQVLNERRLQLAQQETDIAGADLAEVATNLASVQTSRNALLATIGKASGSSLFDYLR
jgi:flagellin-like hook-associated protein FlgL